MVATIKTWTSTLNNTLGGSTTDQVDQYKNAMLLLKNELVAAGWTVTWSSNGSTQSAGDNWATVSDIVLVTNVNVGNAHSMTILQAPATWGSPSSGPYHLFLECVVSSTTNPQDYGFIFHASSFTHNATSGRPSTPTGAVAVTGGTGVALLLSWAAGGVGAARCSRWRTSGTPYGGDVLLFTKLLTNSSFTRGFMVVDPIYARGNNRALIGYIAGPLSTVYGSFLYRGTAQDALTAITPATTTVAANITSWTNGQDAAGQEGYFPIFVSNNGTGQSARYYGHLVDIWGFSSSTIYNFYDSADPDAIKLRGFNGVGVPTSGIVALD